MIIAVIKRQNFLSCLGGRERLLEGRTVSPSFLSCLGGREREGRAFYRVWNFLSCLGGREPEIIC